MARPPDEGVPRSRSLRVRLTPADEAKLDRLRGIKTRSRYVRELISSAADNERGTHDRDDT